MNYWNQSKSEWEPSDPSFDLTSDAFVANHVQDPVHLNANLNTVGAVTTTLRDGTKVSSTPVCIGLYDPGSGRFAVVSTITNCVGTLVGTNQVLYRNAFQGGACASVIYTLKRGSFAQDVVITGRLDPLDYGFPTNSQIQIWTEFYNSPRPNIMKRPLYVEKDPKVRQQKASPDFMDEVLTFGDSEELTFGTGKAFTPPTPKYTNGMQTVVGKEFKTLGGKDLPRGNPEQHFDSSGVAGIASMWFVHRQRRHSSAGFRSNGSGIHTETGGIPKIKRITVARHEGVGNG